MANHKSALKRIKQNLLKKIKNRYYYKSTRTAIKKLKHEENKENLHKKIYEVFSMIDKLSKRKIIHKNKASNLKSNISKLIN